MVLNNSVQNILNKKRQSIDNSMIVRLPKPDDCAHYHYDKAKLDNFQVSLINNENYSNRFINTNNNNNQIISDIKYFSIFIRVQCSNRCWIIRRDVRDFSFLDTQLHKCVFDRKYSKLNLNWLDSVKSTNVFLYYIDEYLKRFSDIVEDSITCGQILHWFEMDNHGNRFINEESDINTPAIGAAFVVKKYTKTIETEISLEIGELISVIEMPLDSFYWKGKNGFDVGFFPAECVELIDEKISQKSNELTTLQPLKKCVSPTFSNNNRPFDLNTSFSDSEEHNYFDNQMNNESSALQKSSKISAIVNYVGRKWKCRRDCKENIVKDRIFGCDLCEYLNNSGRMYPLVLTACCSYIEQYGIQANGIYRISGVTSTIDNLQAVFDEDRNPLELLGPTDSLDVHAVGSLLKRYFRNLPNPLLTYSLFDLFISTMRDETLSSDELVGNIRRLIRRLPLPHLRTLKMLIKHLAKISKFHASTGMTTKNIAIVWAPNLLRAKNLDGKEALQDASTQAVLTEFLITNCSTIFDEDELEVIPSKPLYLPFSYKYRNNSPPLSSKWVNYIEVGPEITPGKYHTVIPFPLHSKRSRFNLPNFKFHSIFTARNSMSSRNRPSLNILRDNQREISNRQNPRQINQLNYSKCISFQNKILCSGDNNHIKRSASFDSYFKKIKTSNFEAEQDQVNNNTMNEMKNETFQNVSTNVHVDGNVINHHERSKATTPIAMVNNNHHQIINGSNNKQSKVLLRSERKLINNNKEGYHNTYDNRRSLMETIRSIEMTSDNDNEHRSLQRLQDKSNYYSKSIFDLYNKPTEKSRYNNNNRTDETFKTEGRKRLYGTRSQYLTSNNEQKNNTDTRTHSYPPAKLLQPINTNTNSAAATDASSTRLKFLTGQTLSDINYESIVNSIVNSSISSLNMIGIDNNNDQLITKTNTNIITNSSTSTLANKPTMTIKPLRTVNKRKLNEDEF